MFTKKVAQDEASYDMTDGRAAAWQAQHPGETPVAKPKWKPPPERAEPDYDEPLVEDVELEAGPPLVHEVAGEQNDVHPNLSMVQSLLERHLARPFWFLQIVSMFCIYGGVVGVIVGIATFPAQSTKISGAVSCTISLSVLYFAICFLLWFARSVADDNSPFTNSVLSMSTVIRKAPMFAVLFLASRMRALQLDPPYGMPPGWMQFCFFGITTCMYLEALLAGFVGATGKHFKGYYGVYLFRSRFKAAHLVHHSLAIITYVLLIPVVMGVLLMESKSGVPAPLSTTLKCVLTFVAAYFGVMLVQDLVMLVERFTEPDPDTELSDAAAAKQKLFRENLATMRDSSIAAGISLALAPLLCILFVATRMRALQITQQMGAPPGWAQDCMLIAVFATCVQSVCCLLMPIFIGSACKVDEDGNPDYDLEPMVGAYAVAIVKYVALMALHGSVIAVCLSVFLMTPENANDSGRFITSQKDLFKGLAITMIVFSLALLFSSAKVVGMAIKMAIESCGELFVGVHIGVDKVALNLFKGYVNVSKVKIYQPEMEIIYKKQKDGTLTVTPTGKKLEWKANYVAKVGLVLIKINLWRLFKTLGKEFHLENLSITGVHIHIEKPNTDMKATNSNIEYIINYLDSIGLIPPEDAEPVKPIELDLDIPRLIINKISLGDIGAGVCIRGVPVVGQIYFHPTIGKIEFPDVQRDIFHGREDLKPGEVIACIISAISRSVFNGVVKEMPKQIGNAAKGATRTAFRSMTSSMGCACRNRA